MLGAAPASLPQMPRTKVPGSCSLAADERGLSASNEHRTRPTAARAKPTDPPSPTRPLRARMHHTETHARKSSDPKRGSPRRVTGGSPRRVTGGSPRPCVWDGGARTVQVVGDDRAELRQQRCRERFAHSLDPCRRSLRRRRRRCLLGHGHLRARSNRRTRMVTIMRAHAAASASLCGRAPPGRGG